MVKKWILIFTMILILACSLSVPVTGATVYRTDHKRAADIVVTTTPAPMKQMMPVEVR